MTEVQLKLIAFDGDGTLWDFESAMLEALDHAAQQMTQWTLHINGHQPSRDDLLADREAIEREHAGVGLTMERLRWLAFARSLARAGVRERPDLTDSLYHAFMALRHAGVRLYDDTLSALEALRNHYSLALITNGNTDLCRLGLDGMFAVVTVAQDCQLWKPDSRIFHLPLQELRLPPHQAVHVGDHQRDDVHGASAAGMKTVWINRRSARKAAWCAPDVEIRSLAELPWVLAQLERVR
jgi:2-haloalkanoic acid dehalogenase type II